MRAVIIIRRRTKPLASIPVDLGQNMGVRVSQVTQAIKLYQAPREISLTFHFWHTKNISSLIVKLAELSNSGSFEWKNVTFMGVRAYHDPSYIFSVGPDPQLPGYMPLQILTISVELHFIRRPISYTTIKAIPIVVLQYSAIILHWIGIFCVSFVYFLSTDTD